MPTTPHTDQLAPGLHPDDPDVTLDRDDRATFRVLGGRIRVTLRRGVLQVYGITETGSYSDALRLDPVSSNVLNVSLRPES